MTRVAIVPRKTIISIFTLLVFCWAPAHSTEQVSFTTEQGVIHLADLKGQAVYLDFWASWCKPCRKSFPWMNKLKKRFADKGLRIIAVNLDKDKALVDKFLKMYKADFTVAYDPEGNLAKYFKVKGMPSSYIIDRNGDIRSSHVGFREKDKAKLESRIKSVLAH